MERPPKVFISYSWDSPEHKQWVAQLAALLRSNGVDAIFDQWDLAPGDDLVDFVEGNIRSADAVLAVITNGYNEKVERRSGGVGFEQAVLSVPLLSQNAPRVIPIVRDRNAISSMPTFLRGRVFADFTDDSRFDAALHLLLSLLVGRPASAPEVKTSQSGPRRQLFVSYSHADAIWLERFQVMLKPAVDRALISLWDDTQIKVGSDWKKEISEALKRAKMALLLVTPRFLASDFIAEQELPPLLDAAQEEGLVVLWVPVSSSFYSLTAIAKYQAAHNPAQPLDTLSPARRNRAILTVCERVIEALNGGAG